MIRSRWTPIPEGWLWSGPAARLDERIICWLLRVIPCSIHHSVPGLYTRVNVSHLALQQRWESAGMGGVPHEDAIATALEEYEVGRYWPDSGTLWIPGLFRAAVRGWSRKNLVHWRDAVQLLDDEDARNHVLEAIHAMLSVGDGASDGPSDGASHGASDGPSDGASHGASGSHGMGHPMPLGPYEDEDEDDSINIYSTDSSGRSSQRSPPATPRHPVAPAGATNTKPAKRPKRRTKPPRLDEREPDDARAWIATLQPQQRCWEIYRAMYAAMYDSEPTRRKAWFAQLARLVSEHGEADVLARLRVYFEAPPYALREGARDLGRFIRHYDALAPDPLAKDASTGLAMEAGGRYASVIARLADLGGQT